MKPGDYVRYIELPGMLFALGDTKVLSEGLDSCVARDTQNPLFRISCLFMPNAIQHWQEEVGRVTPVLEMAAPDTPQPREGDRPSRQ